MREMMPKNIGQWTGMLVTTIIVLGCDMDVLYAMPLGIMAGALATFFVALADQRETARLK
jgi:cell shape-determining protein MreD